MASLIRRQGGDPCVVPSMQEVPLAENGPAFHFAEALQAGRVDVVIFMTGVGTEALWEILCSRHPPDAVRQSLERCVLVVRGPKPTAVLRKLDLRIDHRAAEPNTWQQVIEALEAGDVPLPGRTVAVQEYGQPSDELHAALRTRGATVLSVPVYRWALPDDLGPLEESIRRTIAGEFDLLLFTSAQQVRHVLEVAERMHLGDAWLRATRLCTVASIGPTCTEALHECGLPVDLEPTHPNMGTLVRESLAFRAARSDDSQPR
jgi:uroporphyrinogen-III synthase